MNTTTFDHDTGTIHATVDQVAFNALTRKQRRAQEALDRRFQKRAAAHNCVLQRDCVEAGVQVFVDNEHEYHKLHSARGEASCPACPVCARFSVDGRAPTRFTAAERAGIELQWRGRLAEAKVEMTAPRDKATDLVLDEAVQIERD